jgi:hypothetical protein
LFALCKKASCIKELYALYLALYTWVCMRQDRDTRTTERLRKKFKNNFDLCNFAILVGRNEILSNSQATLSSVLEMVENRAGEYAAAHP